MAAETSSLPEAKRAKYDTTDSASLVITSTPLNPFIFKTGNVLLKALDPISKEPVIGSVSSDALVLASHVWSKFVFPPWEQGGDVVSLTQKEIDCSKDDPAALLMILNIAHLQFRWVPIKLSYKQLYNLAILCDQYDCVQLVQPWLERWLQDEHRRSLDEGAGWLFIAWVFGREQVFENLAAQMAMEIEMNEKGQCLDKFGRLVPLKYIPPGIIENILKIRLATIKKLLNDPYSEIQAYEEVEQSIVGHICHHGNGPVCDALIYGSLTLYLTKKGLWPKKAAEDIFRSVDTVAGIIRNIKVFGLPGHADHKNCGKRNYAEHVAATLSAMPNPILSSHRVHMKGQRGGRLESRISR